MAEGERQAGAVLDYGRPAPPPPWQRWPAKVGFILICGMFGAVLGRAQATSYTSIGFLMFNAGPAPSSTSITAATQAQHVAAIAAPANLAAAAAALNAAGTRVPSGSIAPALRVTAVPQSKLIAVAVTADDPKLATAIAAAVMNSYGAGNVNVGIAVPPALPDVPAHRALFLAAGFVLGAGVGVLIVALRQRRSRQAP
jgi:hypothetical protein